MKKQKGFSLIEMMIVVAIVGILSSISISTYSDFTIRAKSSEIITSAASFKASIVDYAYTHGVMPTMAEIQNPTDLIRRIEFWRARDNRMVIHVYPSKSFWTGLNENVDAILLEAIIVQADGAISWACGPHPTFRNIPEKYLPSTCRDWIDDQR